MGKLTGLYEQVYSWENLLGAYFDAAARKWNRREIARFSAHLEENLIEIQNELIWRTYKVGSYREFFVYEPKKRLVMALSFKDRVVQWAVYRVLNPLIDRQFIEHSYGCRLNKGRTRAADKLQEWADYVDQKPGPWYFLKLDVSKYFYRVSHEVLLSILSSKIDDEGLMWLMAEIINCEHTAFGLPAGFSPDEVEPGERLFDRGMPIGNLTSQMLANICLDQLDQYAKHTLKLHRYVRYMDDIVVLSDNLGELTKARDEIARYLLDELALDLNSKTQINKIRQGVEFVGYRIRPGYKKLKRKSLRKMRARIAYIEKQYAAGRMDVEDVNATMQSYFGDMQHFNSFGLRRQLCNNTAFVRGGETDKKEDSSHEKKDGGGGHE